MFKRKLITSTACAALLAVPMTGTWTTDGWAQIDEVVVTTRKREENLQDVPISVEAFGEAELSRRGVSDFNDLAKYSAGIQFDQGGFAPQDNRIVIRGLSQTRGRSSAALMVDGIDLTGEGIQTAGMGLIVNQRLLDLQRIEIVKGPQSALYGRSAFNGAVQYITKDAEDEFGGELSADIGNYERYSVRGSVTGPVVEDKLNIRVNGAWYDEGGFYDNSLTGNTLGENEGWGGAITTNFYPTDALSFKLRLSYSHDEFGEPAKALVFPTTGVPLPTSATAPVGSFDPTVHIRPDTRERSILLGTIPDADEFIPAVALNPRTGREYPGSEADTFLANLNGTLDLDIGTITSYTGYLDQEVDQFTTLLKLGRAGTCGFPDCSARAQEFNTTDTNEVFSQELRFATDLDGPVNLTIGGLYWQERAEQAADNMTSLSLFPFADPMPPAASIIPSVVPRRRVLERDTDHWSVYGMVEWGITETLKATFEGRYSEEDLHVVGPGIPDHCNPTLPSFTGGPECPAAPTFAPSSITLGETPPRTGLTVPVGVDSSDSFFTPRVTLEWSPESVGDDALFYASIAKGVKPGGVSLVLSGSVFIPELASFDAEKLWSYEIGAKTSWLDSTLQLNGSIFFLDYTEKQSGISALSPISPTTPTGRIVNAGAGEVLGLELESIWQPTDSLTFSVAYSYLDTEYTDFKFTSDGENQIAKAGNCELTTVPGSSPPIPTCIISRNGNRFEDTPEHSFVGLARYQRPLANTEMDWFIEGNVSYQSDRFMDEDNTKLLDAYWNTDVRLGLTAEKWDLLFYVDNLFDDDTVKSGVDVSNFAVGEQLAIADPTLSFGEIFLPDSATIQLPDPMTFGVRGSIRF